MRGGPDAADARNHRFHRGHRFGDEPIRETERVETQGDPQPRRATEGKDFPHGDLTYRIIGAAMEVHRELGPGFLEAVYHEALALEFGRQGIEFEQEQILRIEYKGEPLKKTYKVDFIADGSVMVEIQAATALDRIHEAKALNYLKCSKSINVALLMNFGASKLEWKRFVL